MNGAIACIDDTPASLGTYFAHGGACVRHLGSRPERMRCAVKTIRRGYRPDLDGFEQDVVTRISTHAAYFSIVVLALCFGYQMYHSDLNQSSVGAEDNPRNG